MDAVGASLIILYHHPAVLVGVRVVYQQDPRPVDDVGLLLEAVVGSVLVAVVYRLISTFSPVRDIVAIIINNVVPNEDFFSERNETMYRPGPSLGVGVYFLTYLFRQS